MTRESSLDLLRRVVGETSQAAVARRLGYRPSTISEVLGGTYKADAGQVLTKVVEVYSDDVVACPVLGELRVGECADNRRRPFAATNPQRVQLFRACKGCYNGGAP